MGSTCRLWRHSLSSAWWSGGIYDQSHSWYGAGGHGGGEHDKGHGEGHGEKGHGEEKKKDDKSGM